MLNKKLYILFDVTSSNINRIVLPIANKLIEAEGALVIVLSESLVETDSIDYTSFNSSIIFSTKKKININFNDFKEKKFVTFGYRIADLYLTYKFKKLGFYTYQIQHGMYQDFLKRSFKGYFSNMPKKKYYLKCLIKLVFTGNLYIFIYLLNKDLFKSYLLNNFLIKNNSKLDSIQSNKVFVWGELWKNWFMKNHFYKINDKFIIMGNPDFHKFVNNKKQNDVKVCYIAQTFFEDGRIIKSNILDYIENISNYFQEDLYVKLHPRSKKSLFSKVLDNKGKIGYEFPKAEVYVGHYSSLLSLAMNTNALIILIKINDEEIPDYFLNNADFIFETIEDFKLFKMPNQYKPKEKNINKYFLNTNIDTLDLICENIN
ncbi:hypothetical protein [Polaribacter sp.]|uniref:hypothetical protein n=1 Tax=Polaribacter sp. TaxID=1920175 RepID=UPI0025F92177|nr:hypothetical protein [Polaribacter sp.]